MAEKKIIPDMFKEGLKVGVGGVIGAVLQKYSEEKYDEMTNTTYRKTFSVIVSQLPEPERSRFNHHHQSATRAGVENRFVRLLTKAIDGRPPREQQDYFSYVAMLNWDSPFIDDQGYEQPSVRQELEKLNHDPVSEFFRRHQPAFERLADALETRQRSRREYQKLHPWKRIRKRLLGY